MADPFHSLGGWRKRQVKSGDHVRREEQNERQMFDRFGRTLGLEADQRGSRYDPNQPKAQASNARAWDCWFVVRRCHAGHLGFRVSQWKTGSAAVIALYL
jgi:hypothetical protein